jgi:ADP-ribosylglycohydrolase
MRCTPLAVWCHRLTREEIEKAVPKDVNFTHNNRLSEKVVVTYCLAIQYLLQHPKDTDRRLRTFDLCAEYCKTNEMMN